MFPFANPDLLRVCATSPDPATLHRWADAAERRIARERRRQQFWQRIRTALTARVPVRRTISTNG